MSVIKVWADGRWSNPICGLDKVYLIKTAILSQYSPADYLDNPDDYESLLDGFEINGTHIYADDFQEDHYKSKEWDRFWRRFQGHMKFELKNVESFTFPIAVLRHMCRADASLSAKYDEIIEASKAPVSTPGGYCLFLKFEDE